MVKKVNLIFPTQLFENSEMLSNSNDCYLIEEFLFFRQFQFHKQKLAFHRATMKFYQNFLEQKGKKCRYLESGAKGSDVRLFPTLFQEKLEVHAYQPSDDWLQQRIVSMASGNVVWYHNPMFLNTRSSLKEFFEGDKSFYFQSAFYKKQRKNFHILLDAEGKPLGGKWSFDSENRKKYPKSQSPPQVQFPQITDYWTEAVEYVKRNFSENLGSVFQEPLYPVTHAQSEIWFAQFLEERFREFGDYEDAIVVDQSILNHSVLSPLLNTGLLQPDWVLERVMAFATQNKIPLNSVEGFVRQLIGWREFVHAMYLYGGRKERTSNFWNFSKKISKKFYEGTTGIFPVDETIRQLLKTGYCHHIERLMVLGNFMLLCELNPNEIYVWFMEFFIDAYDWVMVPNVYGMSQFADGGLFATKPYISSSNYLRKMSNYPRGNWEVIWDGLYWRFIDKHRAFFLSNPRSSMMVKMFDKMSDEKKLNLLQVANSFLETI